jgi:alkanesulfonate monooxygenase SsuD/methylene tetrahydromethanopterin reductase-like flavin-dependent oxidoreductase (luciferase family)
VSRVRGLIAEGAAGARRPASEIDVWSIACLDVAERREDALEKLGNILGFVATYILGPDPAGRGVPPELVPAVHELRATYSTRQRDMDPALTRRLGLFDYLRARLAIAGTPDDCVAQVRAAEAAGVTRLMFTVSLAGDPERTVELFGKAVLPRFSRPGYGSTASRLASSQGAERSKRRRSSGSGSSEDTAASSARASATSAAA